MERKPEMPLPAESDFNDPDLDNAEQNEASRQAQDVAEEALNGAAQNISDSEPGSPANPADIVPRDVPDVVSNIENMMQSGRIDMGAFDGEENMDDEDADEEYTRPK